MRWATKLHADNLYQLKRESVLLKSVGFWADLDMEYAELYMVN